jgi:hypothetical protein
MSRGWLSPRGRVLSRAGIGVLGWVIPPGLVDEAVGDAAGVRDPGAAGRGDGPVRGTGTGEQALARGDSAVNVPAALVCSPSGLRRDMAAIKTWAGRPR